MLLMRNISRSRINNIYTLTYKINNRFMISIYNYK